MTESGPCVCSTPYDDIDFGSSGCLLPAFEARLVSEKGVDVEGYDEPGELVVRSKAVVIGYLNNPEANKETFQDGWLRTGDKAVIRKSPKGADHIWIVDRMKEMIKVKVGKTNIRYQKNNANNSRGYKLHQRNSRLIF